MKCQLYLQLGNVSNFPLKDIAPHNDDIGYIAIVSYDKVANEWTTRHHWTVNKKYLKRNKNYIELAKALYVEDLGIWESIYKELCNQDMSSMSKTYCLQIKNNIDITKSLKTNTVEILERNNMYVTIRRILEMSTETNLFNKIQCASKEMGLFTTDVEIQSAEEDLVPFIAYGYTIARDGKNVPSKYLDMVLSIANLDKLKSIEDYETIRCIATLATKTEMFNTIVNNKNPFKPIDDHVVDKLGSYDNLYSFVKYGYEAFLDGDILSDDYSKLYNCKSDTKDVVAYLNDAMYN